MLVDSILNNIEVNYTFNGKEKIIKGLPLLKEEEYFEESFLLHDQTSHKYFTKIMEKFKRDHNEFGPISVEYLESILHQNVKTDNVDTRVFLQDNWASLKNLFKVQPLAEVRDYFGEKNALYFGFVGSFITMLWFPSFIGVCLFLLGLELYYT